MQFSYDSQKIDQNGAKNLRTSSLAKSGLNLNTHFVLTLLARTSSFFVENGKPTTYTLFHNSIIEPCIIHSLNVCTQSY